MLNVPWFTDGDIKDFPNPRYALDEPDGLLALGGNLSVSTLYNAYQHGIFPWFAENQPIMWWSPSVRAVINPRTIHVSKNMKKLIKKQKYYYRIDSQFSNVVSACALPSAIDPRQQTWITAEMQYAYQQLFDEGIAHSVEVYDPNDQLVGGLYGVFINNCFCGESMFSQKNNTSKLALIQLAKFLQAFDCQMIDCQLPTAHLTNMGAVAMPRMTFLQQLNTMTENQQLNQQHWRQQWQHYWG